MATSKPRILLYAPQLVNISETFIYDQFNNVKQFNTTICCGERINADLFPFQQPVHATGSFPKTPGDRLVSKVRRVLNGEKKYSLPYSSVKTLRGLLGGDTRLVHCQYGPTALSMLPVIKKYDIPLLVTFHGYDASRMLADPYYTKKLRELFSYNTYSITVSEDMQQRLSAYGLDKSRNRVIRCGIDTTFFNNDHRAGQTAAGKISLLHSGRITPKKGVPDLVKVLEQIRQLPVHLHIVGDGGTHNEGEYLEIKNYIKDHHLEDVITLHGAQPRNVVKAFMDRSDIFVLNSRKSDDGDMEGTPVGILEAMSSGMAVVSTRHSGISEVIRSGFDGLLAEERDNEGLKNAIVALVNDGQLRAQMGINARATAVANFSRETMMEKIEAFYMELCA
ncbi:MAG TPA: glycosyltransferase family 4 protein [Chitinophagaceae bacterium]|jgi:glycosyltransferase involved in cell wall biosynthesis